ncbi:NAD(P)H-binding protein [Peribacillus frigoritolerans]|uniref:NAD(P)H-binding protein n=1 Tax=Peribacillus frigoritolerans TaxID=450367 RepID=UPI0006C11B62|nr:NAD(P)H-binding protein [Peribacillus frigoritolerans]KOR87154.1 oxidoreductase [Bacillus sp. FJAT-22058]MEB2494734.1 NAD(P)H-binding protein [Peribacillus frigoritolerans]
MKLTIFGANGAIGQLVVKEALQNGDQVIAYVRRENALPISHENLKIVVGNLDDSKKIEEVIASSNAVISALGPSLDKSRKIKALPIAAAHQTIIKVMQKLDKKRLITLGTPTIKAKEDRSQVITILPRIMAKLLFPTGYQEMKRIEQLVKQSRLDWTVVRIINPNVKHVEKGYNISLGDTKGSMNVSRENVAKCLFDMTRKNEYIQKMPIVFNK